VISNWIVTTWRSGSTFLSQFLRSHPASFYFEEPFNYAGRARLTDPGDERLLTALSMLSHFLQCDFSYAEKHWPNFPNAFSFTGSHTLQSICGDGQWKSNSMCPDPLFLSTMCSFYPIQLTKTVRLALNFTRHLLDDSRIKDLRILYLVRDPRAVIQSRKNRRDFCMAECLDPQFLCQDLINDYHSYLELTKAFPGKIKYCDLIKYPCY